MAPKKKLRIGVHGSTRATPVTAFRLGLAKLNISDQKAIFNHLSPEFRAALWQDRSHEAMDRSKSRSQKSLLKEIANQMTPAIYDAAKTRERRRFVKLVHEKRLQMRAASESDGSEIDLIFAFLGAPNNAPRLEQNAPPACNCSISARETDCDDCDINSNCKRVPCVASSFGCGCFWTQRCDGICM
jgi:hypothetical protein